MARGVARRFRKNGYKAININRVGNAERDGMLGPIGATMHGDRRFLFLSRDSCELG